MADFAGSRSLVVITTNLTATVTRTQPFVIICVYDIMLISIIYITIYILPCVNYYGHGHDDKGYGYDNNYGYGHDDKHGKGYGYDDNDYGHGQDDKHGKGYGYDDIDYDDKHGKGKDYDDKHDKGYCHKENDYDKDYGYGKDDGHHDKHGKDY